MWCYGIARNKVRESLRSSKRRAEVETTAPTALLSSRALDPLVLVARHEEAAHIQDALTRLDERSRELVKLIHWDEMSIAEAARIIGMKESSARTKYARARSRLGELLASRSANPVTSR